MSCRRCEILGQYATSRLFLKTLEPTHAPLVLDFYSRNSEFLQEWEPIKEEGFYTLQCHEETLARESMLIENKSMLRLWIFKKEEDSRIIGSIGFSNIIYGPFQSCFLGYKMDKEEINKGYATEAIKKGIEIMFQTYGLHRIEANIMPRNVRSLRVAAKLGFWNEGLSKEYLQINGKWEDHMHMVLINDNY